uniref:G-protein coupled receptors family 1 profile domain-containing protein n=1 Tax=Plectus sambesii TaxID=2011161 RepID=A0A914WY23_9BILA
MAEFVNNATNSSNGTLPVWTPDPNPHKFDILDAALIAYMIVGFIEAALNLPMAIAILKQEAMRELKEYWMISAQAICDSADGIGFFAAGVDRLITIFANQKTMPVTPMHCMFKLYNNLWSWTGASSPIMLLVTSIDRIIACSVPLTYQRFQTRRYIGIMIGGALFISVAFSYIPAYIYPFANTGKVSTAICYSEMAYGNTFSDYQHNLKSVCAFASVLLFPVVVYLFYKKMVVAVATGVDSTALEYRKKLAKKMTISMGISSLATLIFTVILTTVGSWAMTSVAKDSILYEGLLLVWPLQKLDAIANPFLYIGKHEEMRRSMRALFKCQRLPPDVSMWCPKKGKMAWESSATGTNQHRLSQHRLSQQRSSVNI